MLGRSAALLQSQPYKDHSQEHGNRVENQRRNHILERSEAFGVRGDRHDNINASADSRQKQDATDNIYQ